jgi:PTH1 family peptidyl-tRNA hydrolase
MHLLVGLGNPGPNYENTRHNIGWMALDAIHAKHKFPAWSVKFKGQVSKGKIAGHDVILLKPCTYMNLSGESVQPAAAFFKIPPKSVTVLHDDLDLSFLNVRHKVGGGDAGHNGLKSITQLLGTPDYARLRLGIGRPERKEQVSDYVLAPFTLSEAKDVETLCAAISLNAALLLTDPKALLAKFK